MVAPLLSLFAGLLSKCLKGDEFIRWFLIPLVPVCIFLK